MIVALANHLKIGLDQEWDLEPDPDLAETDLEAGLDPEWDLEAEGNFRSASSIGPGMHFGA